MINGVSSGSLASSWRELGHSGVVVSPLGLGAASIAGLFTPVPAEQAADTVRAALRVGISYIDTAPHYGLGLSEERLGGVLRSVDRTSFVLSTKVGRRLRPLRAGEKVDPQGFADPPRRAREWDFSVAGIRSTLTGSLERLGLDAVDVVYLHDPDDHQREVYETGYPALADLRKAGVVRAIGIGMNSSSALTRFVRDLDLDVVLCANRYTLLDQSAATDLLPSCAARGTSVVIGGVFNSGILADPRAGATFEYEPASAELMTRARLIGAVCAEYGVELRAAAVRFASRHPIVASVLVGARSTAEVLDAAVQFEKDIPREMWIALADRALLPRAVLGHLVGA